VTRVLIREAAERDFAAIVDWYEAQRPGLSLELNAEFRRLVANVRATPRAARRLGGNLYRIKLNRFPYWVFYRIRPTHVMVVAIMHIRRRPGSWFQS
jgi:plasmid stabilization system protein ParE